MAPGSLTEPLIVDSDDASDDAKEEPPTLLTLDDLPLGVEHDEDLKSATRLCQIFNEHQSSMPPDVRSIIVQRLKNGEFHHTKKSIRQRASHPVAIMVKDPKVAGIAWHQVTYENLFILAGVYGHHIRTGGLLEITKAVSERYGWDVSANLAYMNGPNDARESVPKIVTQMSRKMVELESRIKALEEGRGAGQEARSGWHTKLQSIGRKAKGALKRSASVLTDRSMSSVGPRGRRDSIRPPSEVTRLKPDPHSAIFKPRKLSDSPDPY